MVLIIFLILPTNDQRHKEKKFLLFALVVILPNLRLTAQVFMEQNLSRTKIPVLQPVLIAIRSISPPAHGTNNGS